MRSRNYYRIRFAVRVLFWGSLIAGILFAVGNLWWVGDHYCWGSMTECFFPKGGK